MTRAARLAAGAFAFACAPLALELRDLFGRQVAPLAGGQALVRHGADADAPELDDRVAD